MPEKVVKAIDGEQSVQPENMTALTQGALYNTQMQKRRVIYEKKCERTLPEVQHRPARIPKSHNLVQS